MPGTDPRKRSAPATPEKRLPPCKMTKATGATLLIDNIRGQQYSQKERDEVRKAKADSQQIEQEYEEEVNFNSPFVRRKIEGPAWRDMRNAEIMFVDGGVGPVFVMERGDIGVVRHVLKHLNKHKKPRFTYTIGSKAINGFANSKKFWVYNYECNKQNYPRLVSRMKAHSELEGWRIRDLGVVPMEKISTHRAIYDHLVRETKASNIDLQHTDPARLFAQQTGVTCLASWVAEKTAEYFPEEDEEW